MLVFELDLLEPPQHSIEFDSQGIVLVDRALHLQELKAYVKKSLDLGSVEDTANAHSEGWLTQSTPAYPKSPGSMTLMRFF